MQKITDTLDGVSGYLFFIGFLTSKLKNVPIALVTTVLNLVSLLAYLVGYLAWSVAVLLYPDHPRKQDQWYGFAQFKQQYQAAAVLGTLATILCLTTPFLLASAWIYTASNLIWNIGEYHKKQNPPTYNTQYSSTKQAIYFRYTVLVTITSAIAAVALSIAFLLPSIAITTLSLASVVGTGLTIASLNYWTQCAFGTFKPDIAPIPVKHSYSTLASELTSDGAKPTPKQGALLDPSMQPMKSKHGLATAMQQRSPAIHKNDDEFDSAPLLSKVS